MASLREKLGFPQTPRRRKLNFYNASEPHSVTNEVNQLHAAIYWYAEIINEAQDFNPLLGSQWATRSVTSLIEIASSQKYIGELRKVAMNFQNYAFEMAEEVPPCPFIAHRFKNQRGR